jgi:D-sedoheptulose 7-phosphate isomerase
MPNQLPAQQDPRHKNTRFDAATGHGYLLQYLEALSQSVQKVSAKNLERAIELVEATSKTQNHIYAIGNGGSASIVDHLCCDWTKGTATSGHSHIKTHSLTANVATLSAIANDFGFSEIFSRQLEFLSSNNDLLIAVSSSGKSENIIQAVSKAKGLGMLTIGLTGFDGGKVMQMVDVSLHVPASNYGIIEDAHQMLMHTIAQVIVARREEN